MPRNRQSKYFWPASAITPADMALLHAAREASRVPISRLIAQAVRQTHGRQVQAADAPAIPEPVRQAA